MRIACIYLPAFALQVQVRQAPHRAGTAFAVVHGPKDEKGEFTSTGRALLVCSKAAWEMGLRPGMSAPQARALAPDIELLSSDITLYQRALEALAESLMVHSLSIDIGDETVCANQANIAVYLRVPKKSRGDDFAKTLLTKLDAHGYKGRIGIADNRFTAWTAAQGARSKAVDLFPKEYCTVPIGGSAAFLAPLPIDLLPLSSDVQHMLETLGIKTLGNFASLPPPSVGRRWNAEGVDFQSLAQGEGPTLLQSFTPTQAIIESIDLEHEVRAVEALAFSLRPLADRACDRLRGRSMAAGRALLRLKGRGDVCTEFPLEPARPTADGRSLFELLRAMVQDLRLDHPVCELELTITQESDPELCELDLFSHGVQDHQGRPSPESVDVAIARLESMFGKDSVNSAQLTESHRPERAFQLTPFAPPRTHSNKRSTKRSPAKRARAGNRSSNRPVNQQEALPLVMNGTSGALRLLDPPTPQPNGTRALCNITIEGIQSPVVATYGPTKVNTEWWSNAPVSRDYYEVETEDGGRYWVFRKDEDGQYYLHGIFD